MAMRVDLDLSTIHSASTAGTRDIRNISARISVPKKRPMTFQLIFVSSASFQLQDAGGHQQRAAEAGGPRAPLRQDHEEGITEHENDQADPGVCHTADILTTGRDGAPGVQRASE